MLWKSALIQGKQTGLELQHLLVVEGGLRLDMIYQLPATEYDGIWI